MEFVPLALTTRTGESFEFAVTRRAENLDEPFELFDDAEIPEGEYWYTRWLLDLSSFSARTLSGSVEVGWGEFYLGQNLSISTSGRWRVNKHLTLRADYEHNRVSLEGESFPVDEVGARADFAFTPTFFGGFAGQWNNEDEEVILNFRLNWIPQAGLRPLPRHQPTGRDLGVPVESNPHGGSHEAGVADGVLRAVTRGPSSWTRDSFIRPDSGAYKSHRWLERAYTDSLPDYLSGSESPGMAPMAASAQAIASRCRYQEPQYSSSESTSWVCRRRTVGRLKRPAS